MPTRSRFSTTVTDSTTVLTQVGNANTGNSVQNSSIGTTVTTTESGAQLQLTQVQVETDSRTQEGNDYSGTFEQLDLASSSTTLTQTSAGVSVQQTNAEATQDAEVGNTISGAYSLNEIDVNAYTLQQTEADGVVTTETGTQYAQAMETGNSALSTSSRIEDDWDSYTLQQSNIAITGLDHSTVSLSGNAVEGTTTQSEAVAGGYRETVTESDGSAQISMNVQYSEATTTTNALVGTRSQPWRPVPPGLQLVVVQFTSVADSGTEWFDAEGAPYQVSAELVGAGTDAVHTDGDGAEGAEGAVALGYADGSGRMSRLRADVAAVVQADAADSGGAALQADAADLGAELFQEYCFVEGIAVAPVYGTPPSSSSARATTFWRARE